MKRLLYIFGFMLLGLATYAQESFDTEKLLTQVPRQLVNDYTNTLTKDQRQALENKLVAFDDSTSTQVAVVIVPTLNGNDIADYGVKLGRAWGIGGKEFSNGVLLLINVGKGERAVRIEVGYGVEGALPDITAKHIIDDVIVPNFKGEDYYRGIEEGTDAIIRAVKGEYTAPKDYRKRKSPGGSRIAFIVILIILFLIFSGGKGGRGGSFMSRRGAVPFILGSLLNSGGRSSGGGWSGGGGGSGGGFGGFGGGSFGGGGASGSW